MVSYALWGVSVVGIKDGFTHFFIFTQWISPFGLWVSPNPSLTQKIWQLDQCFQWLVAIRIFSKGTPVSSIDNTVHQDFTEILLITNNPLSVYYIFKEMKNK